MIENKFAIWIKNLLSVSLIIFIGMGYVPARAAVETGFKDVSIKKLAAQFRKMRRIKGHFSGGIWNDDVDKWMGRKHRLMIELGLRLSNGKYHKKDIITLLDQPDQVARKGDDLFKLITGQPGYDSLKRDVDEFLVYYWRGRHDFLFFTCIDTIVVNWGWWYAGE